MKIFEIIPNLATGGGEKFVIDLSNTLADKGHDCTIVTLYNPSECDVLRCYVQSNVSTQSLNKRPGADFGCMFRIVRYIHKNRPDVVHAHLSAIMYLLFAAIFCRKIKFYATIHSEAKNEAGVGLSKLIRKILFKTGLVKAITISKESEKSFEKFYGFSTTMISNGCSEYYINPQVINEYKSYRIGVDLLLIHVGRICKVKNQLMLIEAFERILKQGVNARLLIAGRIENKAIFGHIKTHLSDRIVYLGECQDIRAIMSTTDAFCLSSIMEGMPITIIEAWSVGCIPIVTPVGGCVNMVNNGINGFIAESCDVDSYTRSLMEFATTNATSRMNIKRNCISDYRNNYSISNTANNYITLFEQ